MFRVGAEASSPYRLVVESATAPSVAVERLVKKQLGQVQWLKSIIPEIWEDEAGEFLEARSSRLAWATQRETTSKFKNRYKMITIS